MKKRIPIIVSLLITAIIIIGCVKKIEKVTTVLNGRVIEETSMLPLNNVNVVVTNGIMDYVNVHTGVTGTFKLNVNFDDLSDGYYLYLDDGSHTQKLELKGVGKTSYDYKDIALYKNSGGGGANAPTVSTSTPTNITSNSATCGGNVTSEGSASVTERGVCYNTSGTPTTSSNKVTSGSGSGAFTCNLTGLSPNTKYYVRAYAKSSVGTSYSSQKEFTTSSGGGGSTITEFTEGFESGLPSTWATIDADGDGYNWYRDYSGHNGSLGFMTSESYKSAVLYPDNYMVTRQIKATASSTFSFWARAGHTSWPNEHFGVFVSTSSQTNASSFVKIQEWTMTAKGSDASNVSRNGQTRTPGTWYRYTVNLGSYANQNLHIAIRHFDCSDEYCLDVDDVELSTSGGGGGSGQTYLYNFDNGIQNWTSIDADGDGFGWVSSSNPGLYHSSGVNLSGTGHNSSEAYVISGSFANQTQTALTPNNYLVSPQRYTISSGASISFYVCAQDATYPAEHYGVAISNSANPTASSFTTIWEETLSAKTGKSETVRGDRTQGNWYLKTINLSSYAGQQVWISIRHFDCTDQFIINVDDITIVTGN